MGQSFSVHAKKQAKRLFAMVATLKLKPYYELAGDI